MSCAGMAVGALPLWRQQNALNGVGKVLLLFYFCCYNGDTYKGLFLYVPICINKSFPELALGRVSQILLINSAEDLGLCG